MNILWTTNITLPIAAERVGLKKENKEGWLSALASVLSTNQEVKLGIVSFETSIDKIIDIEVAGIRFFIIPVSMMRDKTSVSSVNVYITEEFEPELIHINGTEYANALNLLSEMNIPSVISIQGLTHVLGRYVFTGFDMKYIIKHPLFAIWLFRNQLAFEIKGKNEVQYLRAVNHVIGRTDWDRIHSKMIAPTANYHVCNESLRPSFYLNNWRLENAERYRIYVSQANYQIKGAHILIEALSRLKDRYPRLKVVIGGQNPLVKRKGLRTLLSTFDYGHYLREKIDEYRLNDFIEFKGSLSETQVVKELLQSHLSIVPSTIENSPNSLGEAMLLGVPCIASYAGGIPYLTDYGQAALLYRCEEWEMLYDHVCKIFDNDDIALKLSTKERQKATKTHDREENANQMTKIYREIINTDMAYV